MSFWEGLLYVIWRGLAIGVIISAPMGPVGILCVQRTLGKGRRAGFFTGIGAAISDLFYCLLTGFGLSFIEDFLEKNQNIIQLIGSVVLIIFGIYLFKSNPNRTIKKPGDEIISPSKNILNGFLFTFSNPLIIFLIIGLFARFNFMLPDILAFHYVIGYACIFGGALLWWWVVTYIIDKIRAHFNLRSMYMINKVTGTIIMIFGIVGIGTSLSAFANAAKTNKEDSGNIIMNSHRGYAALGIEKDSLLTLDGNDNFSISLPLPDSDFLLDFRIRNLHNASRKSYSVPMSDSKSRKVTHPAWKILLTNIDHPPLEIRFQTIEYDDNSLLASKLEVSATRGDSLLSLKAITDNIDLFCGWNAFRLHRKGGSISLEGGNRIYETILNNLTDDYNADSISIAAAGGALLNIDWMELYDKGLRRAAMSHLAIPDVLHSYITRSNDPLEGVWELFDRSLEEDKIRPGGHYRLIIAKIADGYELVYLSGAKKNPGLWKPGMLKGKLKSNSFDNIFTVEWIDVDGNVIASEGKAEFSDPALLTFQFPYLNSTFRLRKIQQ